MLEVREYNWSTGHIEVVVTLIEEDDESRLAEAWTIADRWSREDTTTDHTYYVQRVCKRCPKCNQCTCDGRAHICEDGELK